MVGLAAGLDDELREFVHRGAFLHVRGRSECLGPLSEVAFREAGEDDDGKLGIEISDGFECLEPVNVGHGQI